jgi:hypothetical protein
VTQDLAFDGAAVQVLSGGRLAGVIASSGGRAEQLSELQNDHGEGPSTDAAASRRPVFVDDLAHTAETRWPAYRADMLSAGRRGVYAYPLQIGASALGILETQSEKPRQLAEAEVIGMAVFSQIALEWFLDEATEPDGSLEPSLAAALDHRTEIARAQGMVMVDLDISLTDAVARLRAYAFAHDEPLIVLARRVIDGFHLPRDDSIEPPST